MRKPYKPHVPHTSAYIKLNSKHFFFVVSFSFRTHSFFNLPYFLDVIRYPDSKRTILVFRRPATNSNIQGGARALMEWGGKKRGVNQKNRKIAEANTHGLYEFRASLFNCSAVDWRSNSVRRAAYGARIAYVAEPAMWCPSSFIDGSFAHLPPDFASPGFVKL